MLEFPAFDRSEAEPVPNADIGIVHDWLPLIGGAERVLQQLVNAFPNSEVYTLFDFLTEVQRHEILGDRPLHVSSLNALPMVSSYYRYLLLSCTRAIESFDMSRHDVVISSSAALAKGVITAPGQPHLAYVHSPARYAWDLTHDYIASLGGVLGPLKRHFAHRLMHNFRLWDMRTLASIDLLIANSSFIAQRIRKVYRRDAMVIYPPVDTHAFTPGTAPREDFYLAASRLVPYKRIDLVVRAFSALPDRRLVVIGEGPEMARIKAEAGRNVEILGYQDHATLLDYMRRARAFVFAAREDFGIMPLEAQACGTPVIALGQGGTAETVRPFGRMEHPTGVWFQQQTEVEIVAALRSFEAAQDRILPEDCRANALAFGAERFRRQMRELLVRGNRIGFEALQLEGALP